VAKGDSNRTLWVALAGIAATAVVGLAGTATSWLSARDDRATQRELARDERTYDRRVAAYLDAIDHLETIEASFRSVAAQVPAYGGGNLPGGAAAIPALRDAPGGAEPKRRFIPFSPEPPANLLSRLRAFGSPRIAAAFEKTVGQTALLPLCYGRNVPSYKVDVINLPCTFPQDTPETTSEKLVPEVIRALQRFHAQVLRLQGLIHAEVG
jgi:hypothetical protein